MITLTFHYGRAAGGRQDRSFYSLEEAKAELNKEGFELEVKSETSAYYHNTNASTMVPVTIKK